VSSLFIKKNNCLRTGGKNSMDTQEKRFEKAIESLIRIYEPLNFELMNFDGLLSSIPYHEWTKGIDISENVIEFSKKLNKTVKDSNLPRFKVEDIFRSTMSRHKWGPWVRATIDKRLDIRETQRPECEAFHKRYGPLPTQMKDTKDPKCRLKPRNNLSGSHHQRTFPRYLDREECRKFHAEHGPIPLSLLDRKASSHRNAPAVSVADFFEVFYKKPNA
jgi:hypothetical protein